MSFIKKLQNKHILVVGGSSGLGFAVAQAALEHGAHVVLASSSQPKLDAAVAHLTAHLAANNLPPRSISAKTCDLADPTAVEANVEALLEFATDGGSSKLDHVVFTAGDAVRTVPVHEASAHDVAELGAVRTVGALMLAKHLPAYMSPGPGSSLTLTGGTMSWRPSPGWSVLIGAAGGQEALARALAVDLRPVRVNCVVPGAVHTELFGGIPEAALGGVLETMRRDTVTGTVGEAGEAAEAYVYLMKCTFATGSAVVADGGRMVGDSKGEDITV